MRSGTLGVVLLSLIAAGCGRIGYEYVEHAGADTGAIGMPPDGEAGPAAHSDAIFDANGPSHDAGAMAGQMNSGGTGGQAGGTGGTDAGMGGAETGGQAVGGAGGTGGQITGGTGGPTTGGMDGTGGQAVGGAGGTGGQITGGTGGSTTGGIGGTSIDMAKPESVIQFQTFQGTVLNWQHPIPEGSNLYLVVSVSLRAFSGVRQADVTLNGVAMAAIGTMLFTNNCSAGMWGGFVSANSTATINIVANRATNIVAGSRLFAGVDPTTPVSNPAGYTVMVAATTTARLVIPAADTGPTERIVDTLAVSWDGLPMAGPEQFTDWARDIPGGELAAGASHRMGAQTDVTLSWTFARNQACLVANSLNPAP